MDASLERRISIASCWASSRISMLDHHQRYEDSYAITQEFREWITCLEKHPELLENAILKCPNAFVEESIDSDELLEL
tara:strand:+ start:730 stop:963 length:234 start_codon:yes stop_codon:yes gene_type:complete